MFRRIWAVIRRHAYETRRNPDRIADIMFWPLIDIVSWGVFSHYLVQATHSPIASPPLLISGIVLWGAFRALQRDIVVGFLSEIWSRNLPGLFASPLGLAEYIVGLLLVALVKLAIMLGTIIIVCGVVSQAPVMGVVCRLLPSLAILLMFGAATGIFVAGLIFRLTTRVQTLAYGVAGILMPLSCVFYPLSALPAPLQAVGRCLPSTRAFEIMRQVMKTGGLPVSDMAWGFGLSTLSLMLAVPFFVMVVRTARRNGHLVRLD